MDDSFCRLCQQSEPLYQKAAFVFLVNKSFLMKHLIFNILSRSQFLKIFYKIENALLFLFKIYNRSVRMAKRFFSNFDRFSPF